MKNKGNRNITLIFYTVYFALTAAAICWLFYANHKLEDRLTAYQAAQPQVACQEIFETHFSDPDWQQLYALAGMEDTLYEGSEAFAAYMDTQLAGRELTCVQAQSESSERLRYLLKAEDQVIGYFTLENRLSGSKFAADWQLDEVTILHAYAHGVTIAKPAGFTVFVNGVALTNDHTVRICTDETDGSQIHIQQLEGLLTAPVITAQDPEGAAAEVFYDDTSEMYVVQSQDFPMDQSFRTAAVRLSFCLGDTVVYTNLFAQETSTLSLPILTCPEGKVFAGWYSREIAADGTTTYHLVFEPNDSGVVAPAGTLEPMTLYALFEDANDNGGNT